MNFVSQLNRFLEPIRIRLRMMVGRAIVSLIDDTKNMQIVQLSLMKDEIKDRVERVQNYGFTSRPRIGAEAVVLFIGGNRDQGLVIAADDSRYRIKNLPEGGVAMYDWRGNVVKMTQADGILIEAPEQKVQIKASGDIEVGNASLKKLINEEFADIYNSHVHNFTAAPSGSYSTSTPANLTQGILSTPVGSDPAKYIRPINASHMTSKLKAQ